MADTTQLVMAGKRMAMPRFFKRLLQVALAVALTAAILFLMIAGNRFLVGPQQGSLQAGYAAWLAFVRRSDILTTMVLTACVSVLLVYWQREKERKVGGGSRPGL
jgi:hypothetical protein